MLKLPAVNGEFAEMLVLVLLILMTCAVASNDPPWVGVTLKLTVEGEPACNVGIMQTTELLTAALQLPPPTLALVNETPEETVPFT